MYCPKCGAKHEECDKFCAKCGSVISTASKPIPDVAPSVPVSRRASAPVRKQAPMPAPSPRRYHSGTIIALIVTLIALLAAIVVIIVLLCGSSEKSDTKNSEASLTDGSVNPSESEIESLPATQASTEIGVADTSKTSSAEDVTEPAESSASETTEPTTQASETTEAPSESHSEDLIEGFNATEQRRVNIFLSNLSECHFGSLGNADRRDLIFLAYLHNKINYYSQIGYEDGYYVISAARVDETLIRFFGTSIEHGSVRDFEYRNNAYYTPAADGEAHNSFTVANEMYDLQDGTYLVYFTVYELDINTYWENGLTNLYYELSPWEASTRDDLTYRYTGTAIVRNYDGGSYTSYQIVDYTINN